MHLATEANANDILQNIEKDTFDIRSTLENKVKEKGPTKRNTPTTLIYI